MAFRYTMEKALRALKARWAKHPRDDIARKDEPPHSCSYCPTTLQPDAAVKHEDEDIALDATQKIMEDEEITAGSSNSDEDANDLLREIENLT